MPSVLTGANLANRELLYLGVSGDGDFGVDRPRPVRPAMRRGVNMTYIVENNGVYGLTKGQFSATADQGSKSKKGASSTATPRSTWWPMALQLGASYVGRSFLGRQGAAGAADQGRAQPPRRRPARRHQPLRRLQQPCGQHQELRLRAGAQRGGEPARFMPRRDAITAMYAPGEVIEVTQHDGSVLRLRKLAEGYDPGDRLAAMNHIATTRRGARC
jgi:2-oxoglutarate ferredoxin oxidoreductase subunit beta